MEYNSIGILITEDCNARCKMCCDSRGLVRGKTLSMNELDIILENIKQCEEIHTIGITGGEPLLYPDLIEHILNYDYGRKVEKTIKTNGFWGKNKEKAKEFIDKNKDNIHFISFSYDEFHKEFISLDNIKNIIDISNDYNIKTEIVGCFLNEGMQPGDVLNELEDYIYKTNYKYQPVINTGQANNFDEGKFVKLLNTDKHDIRCITPYASELLINPQMEVYPCCSQVVENTILNIGNLNDESLSSIIESIKHNKIFHTIFTQGFQPFIEFMDKHNIDYNKRLSSPCELCSFIFKNDWFMKLISDEKFYECV